MSYTYTLKIDSDYDGYFESVVKGAIDRKIASGLKLNYQRFRITSGGWRSYDCRWEEEEDANGAKTLFIDFYSVARTRGVGIEDGTELFNLL